jgi:hypothetical protein
MKYEEITLAEHIEPIDAYRIGGFTSLPPEHLEKIAHMIAACSELESEIFDCLRFIADIKDDRTVRALIGKRSFSSVIELLKDVVTAKSWSDEDKEELGKIITNLKYISDVRNIVAHWKPEWRDGWLKFNRASTANKLVNPGGFIYPVTLKALGHTTHFAFLAREVLRQFVYTRQHDRSQFIEMRDDYIAFSDSVEMAIPPKVLAVAEFP